MRHAIAEKLVPVDYDSDEYRRVCKDLGFNPYVRFVRLYQGGTIGFTVGRPEEIKSLAWEAHCQGYKLSPSLRQRYARQTGRELPDA